MAAIVQQSYAASANDGSPDAVAYGTNPTAGNLLVCIVRFRDGSVLTSGVTSTNNGTWTQAANRTGVAIYYKENCAAGADTVSVAFGSGSNYTTYIDLLEISGCKTSASLDQNSTANNATSTTLSWPSITTTGAGIIIAAAALAGATTKSSLQSGYVALNSSPADGADSSRFFGQYKYSTGAESTSCNCTLGATQSQYVAIANFLDAAGGGSAGRFAQYANQVISL
jgi:hypothetical protein